MSKITIQIEGFQCERCGHEWAPQRRGNQPKVCPKCKSPYWNTPKRQAKGLGNVLARLAIGKAAANASATGKKGGQSNG